MLNVDLHCHSNVSDGVLTPTAVAQYAHKAGVDVWGLTDHDEVGGIAAARAAAAAVGMQFIPGVEISITWAGQTVHIVGVRIDETNPVLLQGLADTRSGRDARGREMAAQLARAGIADAYEGALKYVGNPDLMSRTHFRALPGRMRRLRQHSRSVPQVPDRGQAGLRAAPLGLAGAGGRLDQGRRRHRRDRPSGPLQVQPGGRRRLVRRIQAARRHAPSKW